MAAWKFYVYEIFRNRSCIYVGKGCGNRFRASERERGGKAHLIAFFEHESAALDFERGRIAERLAEGCALVNVTHGNRASWWRRTDSRQMALEVLQELAYRIGSWVRAGRLDELVRISGVEKQRLLAVYQAHSQ